MGDNKRIQEKLESGPSLQNLARKVCVIIESEIANSNEQIMRSAIVKRVNRTIIGNNTSPAMSSVELVLDNGISEWIPYDTVVKIIQKSTKEKRMERYISLLNEDYKNYGSGEEFLTRHRLIGEHWSSPSQSSKLEYNYQLSLITSHLVSLMDEADDPKDDLLGKFVVKYSSSNDLFGRSPRMSLAIVRHIYKCPETFQWIANIIFDDGKIELSKLRSLKESYRLTVKESRLQRYWERLESDRKICIQNNDAVITWNSYKMLSKIAKGKDSKDLFTLLLKHLSTISQKNPIELITHDNTDGDGEEVNDEERYEEDCEDAAKIEKMKSSKSATQSSNSSGVKNKIKQEQLGEVNIEDEVGDRVTTLPLVSSSNPYSQRTKKPKTSYADYITDDSAYFNNYKSVKTISNATVGVGVSSANITQKQSKKSLEPASSTDTSFVNDSKISTNASGTISTAATSITKKVSLSTTKPHTDTTLYVSATNVVYIQIIKGLLYLPDGVTCKSCAICHESRVGVENCRLWRHHTDPSWDKPSIKLNTKLLGEKFKYRRAKGNGNDDSETDLLPSKLLEGGSESSHVYATNGTSVSAVAAAGVAGVNTASYSSTSAPNTSSLHTTNSSQRSLRLSSVAGGSFDNKENGPSFYLSSKFQTIIHENPEVQSIYNNNFNSFEDVVNANYAGPTSQTHASTVAAQEASQATSSQTDLSDPENLEIADNVILKRFENLVVAMETEFQSLLSTTASSDSSSSSSIMPTTVSASLQDSEFSNLVSDSATANKEDKECVTSICHTISVNLKPPYLLSQPNIPATRQLTQAIQDSLQLFSNLKSRIRVANNNNLKSSELSSYFIPAEIDVMRFSKLIQSLKSEWFILKAYIDSSFCKPVATVNSKDSSENIISHSADAMYPSLGTTAVPSSHTAETTELNKFNVVPSYTLIDKFVKEIFYRFGLIETILSPLLLPSQTPAIAVPNFGSAFKSDSPLKNDNNDRIVTTANDIFPSSSMSRLLSPSPLQHLQPSPKSHIPQPFRFFPSTSSPSSSMPLMSSSHVAVPMTESHIGPLPSPSTSILAQRSYSSNINSSRDALPFYSDYTSSSSSNGGGNLINNPIDNSPTLCSLGVSSMLRMADSHIQSYSQFNEAVETVQTGLFKNTRRSELYTQKLSFLQTNLALYENEVNLAERRRLNHHEKAHEELNKLQRKERKLLEKLQLVRTKLNSTKRNYDHQHRKDTYRCNHSKSNYEQLNQITKKCNRFLEDANRSISTLTKFQSYLEYLLLSFPLSCRGSDISALKNNNTSSNTSPNEISMLDLDRYDMIYKIAKWCHANLVSLHQSYSNDDKHLLLSTIPMPAGHSHSHSHKSLTMSNDGINNNNEDMTYEQTMPYISPSSKSNFTNRSKKFRTSATSSATTSAANEDSQTYQLKYIYSPLLMQSRVIYEGIQIARNLILQCRQQQLNNAANMPTSVILSPIETDNMDNTASASIINNTEMVIDTKTEAGTKKDSTSKLLAAFMEQIDPYNISNKIASLQPSAEETTAESSYTKPSSPLPVSHFHNMQLTRSDAEPFFSQPPLPSMEQFQATYAPSGHLSSYTLLPTGFLAPPLMSYSHSPAGYPRPIIISADIVTAYPLPCNNPSYPVSSPSPSNKEVTFRRSSPSNKELIFRRSSSSSSTSGKDSSSGKSNKSDNVKPKSPKSPPAQKEEVSPKLKNTTLVLCDPRNLKHRSSKDMAERSLRIVRIMNQLLQLQNITASNRTATAVYNNSHSTNANNSNNMKKINKSNELMAETTTIESNNVPSVQSTDLKCLLIDHTCFSPPASVTSASARSSNDNAKLAASLSTTYSGLPSGFFEALALTHSEAYIEFLRNKCAEVEKKVNVVTADASTCKTNDHIGDFKVSNVTEDQKEVRMSVDGEEMVLETKTDPVSDEAKDCSTQPMTMTKPAATTTTTTAMEVESIVKQPPSATASSSSIMPLSLIKSAGLDVDDDDTLSINDADYQFLPLVPEEDDFVLTAATTTATTPTVMSDNDSSSENSSDDEIDTAAIADDAEALENIDFETEINDVIKDNMRSNSPHSYKRWTRTNKMKKSNSQSSLSAIGTSNFTAVAATDVHSSGFPYSSVNILEALNPKELLTAVMTPLVDRSHMIKDERSSSSNSFVQNENSEVTNNGIELPSSSEINVEPKPLTHMEVTVEAKLTAMSHAPPPLTTKVLLWDIQRQKRTPDIYLPFLKNLSVTLCRNSSFVVYAFQDGLYDEIDNHLPVLLYLQQIIKTTADANNGDSADEDSHSHTGSTVSDGDVITAAAESNRNSRSASPTERSKQRDVPINSVDNGANLTSAALVVASSLPERVKKLLKTITKEFLYNVECIYNASNNDQFTPSLLLSHQEPQPLDRVLLYDTMRYRRVGGYAAPYYKNLIEALCRNSHFTVYCFQDNRIENLGNHLLILIYLKRYLDPQFDDWSLPETVGGSFGSNPHTAANVFDLQSGASCNDDNSTTGKRPRENDIPFVTTTTITTTANNTKKSKKYDLVNHISSNSNNNVFSIPTTVVKEEEKPLILPAPPVYEPRTHQVYSKANSRPGGHFVDELKPGIITDGPGWWSEDRESDSCDTVVSPQSLEAALAAALVVCVAVDAIHSGTCEGYDPQEINTSTVSNVPLNIKSTTTTVTTTISKTKDNISVSDSPAVAIAATARTSNESSSNKSTADANKKSQSTMIKEDENSSIIISSQKSNRKSVSSRESEEEKVGDNDYDDYDNEEEDVDANNNNNNNNNNNEEENTSNSDFDDDDHDDDDDDISESSDQEEKNEYESADDVASKSASRRKITKTSFFSSSPSSSSRNYRDSDNKGFTWTIYFSAMIDYAIKYNDANVPFKENKTLSDGRKLTLGRWLCDQRCMKRQNIIPQERLNLFQKLVNRGKLWWDLETKKPRIFEKATPAEIEFYKSLRAEMKANESILNASNVKRIVSKVGSTGYGKTSNRRSNGSGRGRGSSGTVVDYNATKKSAVKSTSVISIDKRDRLSSSSSSSAAATTKNHNKARETNSSSSHESAPKKQTVSTAAAYETLEATTNNTTNMTTTTINSQFCSDDLAYYVAPPVSMTNSTTITKKISSTSVPQYTPIMSHSSAIDTLTDIACSSVGSLEQLGTDTKIEVKNIKNVFCCIRPPGHHAGRYGSTRGCTQNGFCLLNNVAIGAYYSRIKYGYRRIAIIDLDAHFGNGTSEIFENDPHVFYASVHQQSDREHTPFFPSSGCCLLGGDLNEYNRVFVNVYPGIKTSMAHYGGMPLANTLNKFKNFRLSFGYNSNITSSTSTSGVNSNSSSSNNNKSGAVTASVYSNMNRRGRDGYLEGFENIILPRLKHFQPDIIFLSSGFDGVISDPIGGGLELQVKDFQYMTKIIHQLADELCAGRVISVLEGGYDLKTKTNGLARSVEAHVMGLMDLPLTS